MVLSQVLHFLNSNEYLHQSILETKVWDIAAIHAQLTAKYGNVDILWLDEWLEKYSTKNISTAPPTSKHSMVSSSSSSSSASLSVQGSVQSKRSHHSTSASSSSTSSSAQRSVQSKRTHDSTWDLFDADDMSSDYWFEPKKVKKHRSID